VVSSCIVERSGLADETMRLQRVVLSKSIVRCRVERLMKKGYDYMMGM
jgi:hypothetical protein